MATTRFRRLRHSSRPVYATYGTVDEANEKRVIRRGVMNFVEIDPSVVAGREPIAESDQFAMYATGDGSYMLVQRHQGTAWTALQLSGDGVFRVGSLFVDAMRHLYREVASELSPVNLNASGRAQAGH